MNAEHRGRVPTWALLGGIVVLSAALRLWLVRDMVAPFVFIDELIYSELAKNLAETGSYAIRELPSSGYSILYPALVAPAWAAFEEGVAAYGAAKAIGAVVMSLAAVPTYLLAARVSRRSLALLCAATAVAIPSMAYTGTITTESLFYPVALLLAWLAVRWLERPSWPTLLEVLGALAVAFATRSQALAFVPALATAPLVLAALRGGRPGAALRPYLPLWVILGAAGVAAFVLQVARGRSLTDLLGAYAIVGEGGYDVSSALRFWLWHVEIVTLYVLAVPVAVLGILLVRARGLPAALQAHLAATLAFSFWSTLAVGMFASRFASDRVQDRYLFFLAPLFVVVVAAWVELGAPRPRVASLVSAAIALALVVAFPYTRFIGEPAKSDTLSLIPLWAGNEHLLGDSYRLTVAAIAAALLAVALLVPARHAVVVPLLLLAVFAVLSRPVWTSDKGFRVASAGALFQGIRGVDRTWIDEAVGPDADVVALWTGNADRFTINQNEFFNRSVGRVFYTDQPTPGGVGELPVTAGPGGVFRLPGDGVVRARYALLDQTVIPDGTVVRRDPELGTTLWRLAGPLSTTTTVRGRYPGDTWTRPVFTWTRVRCRPGRLVATMRSDPTLFSGRQTVTAVTSGRRASVTFDPADTVKLPLAVTPDSGGRCAVRFEVRPSAVPADVVPGSVDERRLGVHLDTLLYTPR